MNDIIFICGEPVYYPQGRIPLKAGDLVRHKPSGIVGTITAANTFDPTGRLGSSHYVHVLWPTTWPWHRHIGDMALAADLELVSGADAVAAAAAIVSAEQAPPE